MQAFFVPLDLSLSLNILRVYGVQFRFVYLAGPYTPPDH
jgi:hypothetical protein